MSVLPELDALRNGRWDRCRLDQWMVGSRRKGDGCVGLAVLSAEGRLWLLFLARSGRWSVETALVWWILDSIVVGRGGL
jgi:hypothetical protein